MSVTEACSNVVRHAYPNGAGELSLAARVDGHQLVVEVADEGIGLNGNSTNKGLGVGVEIMHHLADTRITSDDDGTIVRLRFHLPAGGCDD